MSRDHRLTNYARQMRHEPVPADKLMWKLLRHRQLAEFRFRRQQPIPPYIADFFCSQAKLIIELDGESHLSSNQQDQQREQYLNSVGYLVLRFWNTQLFDEEDTVLETIYRCCIARTTSNND